MTNQRRCPKDHEVREGVTSLTALGDTRYQYLCFDCGHRFEGDEIRPATLNVSRAPAFETSDGQAIYAEGEEGFYLEVPLRREGDVLIVPAIQIPSTPEDADV